jgi:uncharacterized SAM-binding protein YcdF (DUF218 family)
MITADDDRNAQIIWEYMQLHHRLQPCDAVFGLGAIDTRIAERAAQLFLDGYGTWLIFSGGVGRFSKEVFAKPEAEVFADIAVAMGVPREHIITETRASNTGQNISYTYDLLQARGLNLHSLLLVQKSYMERRVYATFKKQWPNAQTRILITSPQLSYEQYCSEALPKRHVINCIVGDLQRIKEYPARGYQIPQEIPAEVWQAYERLVAAGFNEQLMKD